MANKIPTHVAIIMDGNGRWAQQRGLPRSAGHRQGVKTVRRILEASSELGISVLTLYAFSQENWKRPRVEIMVLMNLLNYFLDKEIKHLMKEGVQLRTMGKIEALPNELVKKLEQAVQLTQHNKKIILNLALNYGARAEILRACSQIAEEASRNHATFEGDRALTEEKFSEYLYTRGLPDPDLLIRTSGEMRLSNFLLWQLSYSEIVVTKKLWPDFQKDDFLKALKEYGTRQRRFGGISA